VICHNLCKIVSGEKKEEFLYEDDQIIVHRDINPRAKIHLLITSKKHYDNYRGMMSDDPELLSHIGKVVLTMIDKLGLKGKPYTWGFHSDSKQSIKHLHAQLLSVEDDELVLQMLQCFIGLLDNSPHQTIRFECVAG
jgi:histidine triad (HIT) family protein